MLIIYTLIIKSVAGKKFIHGHGDNVCRNYAVERNAHRKQQELCNFIAKRKEYEGLIYY